MAHKFRMVFCSHCQKRIPDALYCIYCGEPIDKELPPEEEFDVVPCWKCGRISPNVGKYCGGCGTKL